MSNPRIYIVIATFLPTYYGGAEMQAFEQSRNLRRRGYEITVVTFRHNKARSKRDLIEGVPVIRVAGAILDGREKLPRLLQKLAYLLAIFLMGWTLWRHRRRYDILHVYQLSLLVLPVGIVCRLAGKSMLVAVRSADSGETASSHNKTSLLTGPLDANAPWLQVDERLRADGRVKVGSDLEMLARLGKPVVGSLFSLLHSNHATVVALSSRMKSSLAKYGFNRLDVQLIPNGVDITRFHPVPADRDLNGRAQVVVCISRLAYEKGVDVLLQAWNLVHQQAPQAQLIIVGDGGLQFQLEHMSEALGIANGVEFTGLQSDIPAQLHRGSISVLPSRWEGMPNALLEAMACGLPTVATRVSGSEDIIQHGVNGLLVESEDYRAMAQALLTLLHDPVLTQKYGRVARETVGRYYSFEKVMDRYEELYHRVAEQCCQFGENTPSSRIC